MNVADEAKPIKSSFLSFLRKDTTTRSAGNSFQPAVRPLSLLLLLK